MKKSVILILIFSLLLQSVVFAGYDGGSIVKESEWSTYKTYNSLDSALPYKNPKGLPFNKELWEELNIVVYGDYSVVSGNDFKAVAGGYYSKSGVKGEYRYHGEDKNGNKVNNITFPDDAPGTKPVENKTWVYDPWNPSSLAYASFLKHSGNESSTYNYNAINYTDTASKTIAKWINQGLSFPINNSTINGTDTAANKDPIHYLNIESAPTTVATGQGTMYHKSTTTGKIWYQTFPVKRIQEKIMTEVNAEIPIIAFNGTSDTGDVVIKVRVSGELLDDAFYGDPILESAHYTRKDLKKWGFTLTDNITGKTFSLNGTKSSAKEGYADFEVTIPQTSYSSFLKSDNSFDVVFTGKATVTFFNEKTNQDTVIQTKAIKGTSKLEVFPADIYNPPRPEPIEFDVTAPRQMLDVDKFGLSLYELNTDKAVDRYVTIDGRKLSEADELKFLSGQYMFPKIGEDRVYDYAITYVHENADLYFWQGYVIVYDSIPRASVRVGGTQKVNRKTIVTADPSITSDYLESRSNVQISEFTITSLDGQPIYYGTTSQEYKEYLRKTPGTVIANVKVSNEYGSRSYQHEIYAEPDHVPDLITVIWNNNLARGEALDIFSEGASLDGDTIVENKYEIFYDSNNDGTPETSVFSGLWNGSTTYKPTKLGNYKIVFTVKEEFGAATIPEHITEADKLKKTVEREFFVDNLIPMTKVYSDIEYNFPALDVAFLIDQDYPRAENDYVRDKRVDIINNFRVNSMVANVDVWDLHTYEYSQTAYARKHTSRSYPPSTTYYSSGGYSGTLTRYDVDNYPYTVDEGSYKTRTLSKSVTMSKDSWAETGTSKTTYADGSYKITTTYKAWYSYSDSQGYSGSTTRTGSSWTKYDADGKVIGSGNTNQPTATGTAYKTETYWDSNYVTYNDYYGDYSGTVYKYVKQEYAPNYQTNSNKYIVYMAKDSVSNQNDLTYVKDIARDAKIIFIGNPTISSQVAHDYFIPYSTNTAALINEIVKITKAENPVINELSLLINEPFNLSFTDIDAEGDPIVETGLQYVHVPNYFNNPLGQEAGTLTAYSNTGYTSTVKTSFSKPGKYTVYRRIKDAPVGFTSLGGYSNLATLELAVHRKPIAQATLDWDFNPVSGDYKTTWVDQSYDPDFQYSDANKGIADRKIKYRKDSGNWIYEIPNNLSPGNYTVEYIVMDKHGVWSDPWLMNFTLSSTPAIQFDAKLGTRETKFSTSSIPVTEFLKVYDAWTRYPYTVYLNTALYNGTTRVSPILTTNYSTATGIKNGNDIFWNEYYYEVPSTLADGNYSLKIDAIGLGGIQTSKSFAVTVNTPINLQIVDFPNAMVSGKNISYNINATTTKYVNDVRVTLHKGTSYQTVIILGGTQQGYLKNWIKSYTVPTMPDGTYTAEYKATTTNGKVEIKTIQYTISRNQPPVANFTYNPTVVYEGDTLSLMDASTDPDNNISTHEWIIKRPNSTSYIVTTKNASISNVVEGTYTVTKKTTDTFGLSVSISKNIIVHALSVAGQVQHTTTWNDNRIKYNQSKSGTNDSPRAYNTFWSGENFVLSSTTTQIDPASTVQASSVKVEILNEPYSTYLTKQVDGYTWKGVLWDRSMIDRWGLNSVVPLTFRFTATYSNGKIKTKDVTIYVDHRENYWELHRKY